MHYDNLAYDEQPEPTPHRLPLRPVLPVPATSDMPDSGSALDALLGWNATVETAPRAKPGVKGWVKFGVQAFAAAGLLGLLLALAAAPMVGATVVSVKAGVDYWNSLPVALPTQALPQRSVIKAADGSTIAVFYSENRVPVTIDKVPQVMRDAVVAIEDSRFYTRPGGLDVRGTARALATNAFTDKHQGGSTIEQQYVKNILLNAADTTEERAEVTDPNSYLRKLKEARYATALHEKMTKDQILEGYLNAAYFGDGAYGIGTAARHYFGVPVQRLTLPQAALLAGLVRNPTGYDPTENPGRALNRRDTVLARMLSLGKITRTEYDTAIATPVRLKITDPANGCTTSRYPFYCQWVKQILETDPAFGETKEAREQTLYRGGMTIHTALDPAKQDLAQTAVDEALGRSNRVVATTVTVEPGTGNVVAMALNRGYGRGPDETMNLLPVLKSYQPGSNFKPFTLAAALERGYNLATVWNAPNTYAPDGFNYPNRGFTNSGSGESGPLTAAQALWRSSNTWFVHLETQVGVLNVADTATRLGITSIPRKGPMKVTERDAALTLGTYEVSPLEMAGAYATFAAHGIHCKPHAITAIETVDGHKQPIPNPGCRQAITAGVADTVAAVMQGTIDGPDPHRTGKTMHLNRPAAGKTGTTQGNAAVWFSGFTPQYATSVQVSDPRGGFKYPLRGFWAYGDYYAKAYGYSVAGPIWKRIMTGIHDSLPTEQFAPIDPATASGAITQITPDVRGLSAAQAWQVLTANGLHVKVGVRQGPTDEVLTANSVWMTNPAPGDRIGYDGTVVLWLTAGSNITTSDLQAATAAAQKKDTPPATGPKNAD